MSFANLQSRNRSRFTEVQAYLNHLSSLEPRDVTKEPSIELKIQRGLFYVQLYAAFEKSINDAVETTLLEIRSKTVKNIHYNTAFNTIALQDKLKGFKDCGYRNALKKAADIFEKSVSRTNGTIDETVFSNSLQNIWFKTIQELYRSFGMPDFHASTQEIATIDEIVDKRNMVAHGREKASTVGERHRTNVLRQKYETISEISIRITSDMEEFYNNKRYIKPNVRRKYA